jgi:CO/xanthine dehydrogenase Mo-binding subunit
MQLAAVALQADEKDLSIEKNCVVKKGTGASVPFVDLAKLAAPITALPLGIKPGMSGEGFFRAEHMVYPYGVHMALVEVDQETGFLKIHKYLIAYDIGRAINPMLVEGQLVGGMAQGLGGALLEEFSYDSEGQLLAGSFMDYLLPSSMEVPPVEIVLTEDAPSPLNPLGVKGVGEGGTVGVGAALANAVCNALGGKVEIKRLPLTPDRVLDAVKSARAAAAAHA